VDILSFPFSFNPQQPGYFYHVEQGSDGHKAQEVAAFWLTHKGERPIYQEYGVNDPTFAGFDDSQFSADFSTFYAAKIPLTSINITQAENAISEINVEFE
jgi:hypothetical protein